MKRDRRIFVEASSAYGEFRGQWRGEEPKIYKSYYVELEFPKVLTWGVDILKTNCREYRVWCEDNDIFMNVKKEVYDDFKCLTAGLGDHLILIETNGVPISKGPFLKIILNGLLIYPIET
jgi:hypothetical protein